jgi:hypothetical protein
MKELWNTPYRGSQSAVNGYYSLRQANLKSLKGLFERKELQFLFDIFNGDLFKAQPNANVKLLIVQIQTAANDRYGLKWEINALKLKEKVGWLSFNQCYYLLDEISRYWNDETNQLERFIDALT